MRIAYKAIDNDGHAVEDVLEATSVAEALEGLRREGCFVTDLREADEKTLRKAERSAARARLSRQQLLFFTRQMAMLLKAGSPIVPAIAAIAKQMRPGPRAVLDRMRSEMEQGLTLADSLRLFPDTFSNMYVAVIAAGEQSANLPGMFTRLADLVSHRQRLRNRVLAALAYPCLLMGLSAAILLTMVLFVVPRFAELFKSLGAEMPWSTGVIFGLSHVMRGHPILLGILAVMGLVVIVVGFRSAWARQKICDLQTRVPLVGVLARRLIQAQIFRVMGVLMESHVSMMDMLQLGRQVTRNRDFQTLCDDIQENVERGNRFSDAVIRSALVSPSFAQAISTGEEAGHLEQALLFVADILDDENAQMLGAATKMLEPVILILMGFMVGGIAISLFLPLFDLAATSG